VENVTEVLKEVGDWKRVAQGYTLLTDGLRIPNSIVHEIEQQSSSERDRSLLVGEYWVKTNPVASWMMLASVLYQEGEEKAATMAKQFLPKGMCISPVPEIV